MLYVRTLCCCKFVGFYRAVSKEYPSERGCRVWEWEKALRMGDDWMEFGGVRSEPWAGYLYWVTSPDRMIHKFEVLLCHKICLGLVCEIPETQGMELPLVSITQASQGAVWCSGNLQIFFLPLCGISDTWGNAILCERPQFIPAVGMGQCCPEILIQVWTKLVADLQ